MATELMGWGKVERRWQKRYRGKLYAVSPRQLGTEATKEASRTKANLWWQAKQREIDEALGKAKQHPAHIVDAYDTAIANWRAYARWHRRNEQGDIEEAQRSDAVACWLEEALQADDPPYPLTKEQLDPLTRYHGRAEWFVWIERLQRQRAEENAEQSAPKENTVRAHIDQYLAVRKVQAEAKGKITSYQSEKQWLEVFRKWVDPTAAIDIINENLWERFFVYLSGKVASGDFSPATMKNYQAAARMFIRNRWENKLIELPRNLTSKALAVRVPVRDPVLFSPAEIKTLLETANDRQRLYCLLSLNCGMYGVDIGCLRHDEVDWTEGRIKRQRSKTRDRSANVPKVDYLLWKETFDLLTKHRADHPDLALTTENGGALWEAQHRQNTPIKCAYFRLMRKVPKPLRKPLKSLRKTGATLLENSPYGRFAEHYLGEAPRTIASRHYTHKNGAEFDTAIKWLGQQLGIEPVPPPSPAASSAPQPATPALPKARRRRSKAEADDQ